MKIKTRAHAIAINTFATVVQTQIDALNESLNADDTYTALDAALCRIADDVAELKDAAMRVIDK